MTNPFITIEDDTHIFYEDGRIFSKFSERFMGAGNGYLMFWYQGRNQLIHRVLWVKFNGEIPEGFEINHIDNNPKNNNINNLNLMTHSQNQHWKQKQKNNTSGFKGISWYKRDKKWRGTIMLNKKYIFSMRHENKEELAGIMEEFRIAYNLEHGTNLISIYPEQN